MTDLYDVDLDGLPRMRCGGNVGDSTTGESCVVLTEIPGSPGSFELTDSKRPELTGLRFSKDELVNMFTRIPL
ncbi:DUF397 domain-containing protein [Longispora urticae]